MLKTMAAAIGITLLLNACGRSDASQDVVSKVCGFPDTKFPSNVVVFGAAALQGRPLNFQIDQRSGRSATQIDVVVNYPGTPVALMLGASNPTIWNISWTENTIVAGVYVNGYYRQRVAGLKKATPLLISTYEDKGPCETGEFRKAFGNDGFFPVFNYGLITEIAGARKEQAIAREFFGKPVSKIFPVDEKEGTVLIGKPIGITQEVVKTTIQVENNQDTDKTAESVLQDQEVLTSRTTTPTSFHNANAPLAGQAGLEQAVASGTLRRATLDDAAEWIAALKRKYDLQNRPPPNLPPDLNNAFVVLKPFVYPSGLYGGNSATFYIPVGVPMPQGTFGHSRVYDMNSISLLCTASSACGESMTRGELGAGSTQQSMTIGK